MKKCFDTLFLIVLLGLTINAQTYEFPINIYGFDRIPETENTKGIRTILYVMQREDHVFETRTETFDKTGKRIEVISQHAGVERTHSGKMIRTGDIKIYAYDSSGKLSKVRYFLEDGQQLLTEEYKYDEKQMLIEQVSIDMKGKREPRWKYIRNPEKREVEINFFHGDDNLTSSVTKNVAVFNDKGVCIKKIEYKPNGSIDTTTTFEYNEKGLVSKYTKNYDGFYGSTYHYKYDAKGNWIERQTIYFQSDQDGGMETRYDMSEYRMVSYYEDKR